MPIQRDNSRINVELEGKNYICNGCGNAFCIVTKDAFKSSSVHYESSEFDIFDFDDGEMLICGASVQGFYKRIKALEFERGEK